ncbi:HflK protein [Hahella chejuensis KCTC 2396]|uniref:Protein HflK n=1 Tax=Hahella chejuensis (strain KCTC 2396) TaxID=349521 RepID=Q2SBC4_HAHCH|nr:FtsH protease activity modulator HflK [Hahella chejuensis]ABC32050.1 HflK protein [Hahella chejuensis KCTC 2396]
MAWNEPGGNNNQDPWGSGRRGNKNDGPPDLDEVIRKGLEKVGGLFGGKSSRGGSSGGGGVSGGVAAIIIVVLVLLAVSSSVFRVDEKENAIVLRFGKYLDTRQPGLQFKIPLIDQVFIEEVTSVRNQKKKGHMLTEDENIVDIDLTVQYVIGDLRKYTLVMRDPVTTLDFAIDSALRHEVGSESMDKVLTEGRAILAINVQDRLQRYLDFYGSGIEVKKVNINAAQPPAAVKSAFEEVQRAKEDEQKVINRAQAYKNQVVPEARGKAQRVIEEAKAYRDQVIAQAEGETQRFLKVLEVYESAPGVTRERLYIDTMEKVLSGSSKVLVDQGQGNNIMYLPLDKMLNRADAAPAAGAIIPRNVDTGSSGASRAVEDFRSRNEVLSRSRGQ